MPDREEVSDWASFFGDLSRPHHEEGQADEPVEWRVHDKTHLEFAIDYPVARSHPTKRVWEAYFFVPESFRIHEATYSKKAIYEDLQSYVRYAVPEMRFEEIVRFGDGAILDKVSAALQRTVGTADDSPEAHEATRLLRLYACLVRASGLDEVRRVERNLTGELESQTLRREAIQFVIRCDDLARAFRAVVAGAERRGLPDEVLFALKWTDEATSIALETMCADLALRLERDTRVEAVHPDLAEQVASHAVSQATYRQERGY
ncbi:MAG: hypothetical protein ACXWUG_16800, partial [Polyangiales bacterium]